MEATKLFTIFEKQKNFVQLNNQNSFANIQKRLLNFVSVYKMHQKELIETINSCYNSSLWDVLYYEIKIINREIDYFVKNIKKFANSFSFKNKLNAFMFAKPITINQPYGSVLLLFNHVFPLSKIFRLILAALVCGNVVVAKLPKLNVELANLVKKIFSSAYNENLLYFLDENISEADLKAVSDFGFDLIYYNGDSETAKSLVRNYATKFCKVVYEIRNKNPVIVDETADLNKAAKKIVFSKLLFSGQTEQSIDFLVIHESIIQNFITALRSEFQKQFDKEDSIKNFTKIGTNAEFEEINNTLKKFLVKNRIIFGDHNNFDQKINFILIQVDDLKSNLLLDDIASPILPVVIFNSFADVKGIIEHNDCPKCVYVFSKNKSRINQLLNDVESCNFVVNDTMLPYLNNLEFGGIKYSGSNLLGAFQSLSTFSYKRYLIYKTRTSKKTYLNVKAKNEIAKQKIAKIK
ncbi:MAG: aldehyde dehydrogenase family protein [Malacoplasma sp.]|nr:aldehyde dehydrogenase family protein [Malacoplasma sp.]